jgi:hypothetical protein
MQEELNDGGAAAGQEAVVARAAPVLARRGLVTCAGAAVGQAAGAVRGTAAGQAACAKATCAAATRRGATRAGEVPCAGAAAGQAADAVRGAAAGQAVGAVRGAAAGQAVEAAVSASAARAMDTPASASVSWARIPWSGTLPHLQHGLWTPFNCVSTDAATSAQPFIAGLGAPTTFTGGAGWPDWWTGAAKAALGPNWLHDDPLSGGPSAMRTELDQTDDRVEEVPDQVTTARRKRGRAASKAPVPATAAVDIDLTQDSR